MRNPLSRWLGRREPANLTRGTTRKSALPIWWDAPFARVFTPGNLDLLWTLGIDGIDWQTHESVDRRDCVHVSPLAAVIRRPDVPVIVDPNGTEYLPIHYLSAPHLWDEDGGLAIAAMEGCTCPLCDPNVSAAALSILLSGV